MCFLVGWTQYIYIYLQMDKITNAALKMLDADDGKSVKEEEFKKLLTEILGSIMLQLEGNLVSVSTNSVVHEPLATSSSLLQPPSSESPNPIPNPN